jgi:hypothetical protein
VSFEQNRCGNNVLARPGEEWGTLIIFEDPPVDIGGVGACPPTISAVSNLALEFGMFLLQLEACLLELLLPVSQLLQPHARRGLVSLPGSIVGDARGSVSIMDAFNVPLWGSTMKNSREG